MSAAIDQVGQSPGQGEAPFLHRLARRIEEYGRLARFDRPIGTWLLLWPTLWALWIAGRGRPDPGVLIVFVAGVVVMRAAGCIINDFADRNIDAHVRRTRDRPLAARRVSPAEALGLFLVLMVAALWLVMRLNRLTIELAVIGAALTASYPFVKRFFPLPQLYLGLSFGGWSIPMAFAAQLGAVPRVAWVLYIAAVIWAVVYDTQYAMVDREDDRRVGIQSSALLFADLDRLLIGALQAIMLIALALAGHDLKLGTWYTAGLAVVAGLFVYQQWLIRRREPAACLRAFLNNNYVGMAIFIGVALHYVYAR